MKQPDRILVCRVHEIKVNTIIHVWIYLKAVEIFDDNPENKE